MAYVIVTPSDIEDVWRPLTAAEEEVVPGLVQYAWLVLSREVPGLADRLAGSQDLTDLVRLEIAFAIKRVLVNPDFTRQISTTVDDATVSRTVDAAVSSGLLYFPADALDRLRPRRTSGAFSIRPSW